MSDVTPGTVSVPASPVVSQPTNPPAQRISENPIAHRDNT
jgi:hypothetical protein